MQTAAKSNFIFTSISSLNSMAGIGPAIGKPELNQQISQTITRRIHRRQSINLLAERLIAVADLAYPFRQMDVVEQASDILLNLPLSREFTSIANYYKAFCLKRRGQFDEARVLFERVAEEAAPKYQARAIIALGSLALSCGDVRSATPLYIEGSRAIMRAQEFDPLAAFYTQSAFAIMKSIDGNHKGALTDLGEMFPLVRAVSTSYMPLYYNHLNSLSVELLESGRITEARNVSKIVLASPFVGAYPEYHDTGIDIALRGRRASRSLVSFGKFNLNAQNVLYMRLPEHAGSSSPVSPLSGRQRPAKLFSLQGWKEKMVKEPNGDQKDGKSPQEMTQDEMLYEIINIFTEPDMDVSIRIQMLESIQKIASQKRGKKQDKGSGKETDED